MCIYYNNYFQKNIYDIMIFQDVVFLHFVSFIIILQVFLKITLAIRNEYVVNKGENITINCTGRTAAIWIRSFENETLIFQNNDTLIITNVSETDSGVYVCISAEFFKEANSSNIMSRMGGNDNYLEVKVNVRKRPGPVSKLYFKASTILGYLIWRFNKENSGGYPVRSFTAEYRQLHDGSRLSDEWSRLDPVNISPNVRQMEVYHLLPNTTYEFRIWANNELGPGDIVSVVITTLPEINEEDLIRLLMIDISNFDVRVWMAAVIIFFGTLVVLAVGLCVVLAREFNKASSLAEDDDGVDNIELVPNIILNPVFFDLSEQESPCTRTIIFGEDDGSYEYDGEQEEKNKVSLKSFKRKLSIFFTGHNIKQYTIN